ncbi:MAG: aldolase [Methylocystaceae bacterium]|nr:MAG: aldolase [Methylocystaceae bacterium]
MRSYLLVGAARDDELAVALSCGADALVLDLGDWANGGERARAREAARRFLLGAQGAAKRPASFVLVAPLDSAAIDDDLETAVSAGADGVFLSRACGGASIQHLSAKLAAQEAECGRDDGATRIVALATQTPSAIFELATYAGASRRLAALAFDFAALRLAIGAQAERAAQQDQTTPFGFARAAMLFAAATARVAAIDRPFPDAGDESGLREECLAARRDGFAAKLAVHPSQILLINETFAQDPPTL